MLLKGVQPGVRSTIQVPCGAKEG